MQFRTYVAPFAAFLLLGTPALAVTTKEKMETCKFGAADQKLTGKAQQDFIKKCMANEPAANPAPATPTKKN